MGVGGADDKFDIPIVKILYGQLSSDSYGQISSGPNLAPLFNLALSTL